MICGVEIEDQNHEINCGYTKEAHVSLDALYQSSPTVEQNYIREVINRYEKHLN